MPKGPGRGYFFAATPATSSSEHKRTVVVIDGQNLFRGAREALGYISPTIARRPCDGRGWQLVPTRFYRGIPRRTDNRLASLLGRGIRGDQLVGRSRL